MIKAHNILVYETKNYDLFKLDKRNRPVSSTKDLEESIKTHNYCFHEPILVSADYTIIEGQHRFKACRNLGLPIFFRVCQEDVFTMMQTLNRGRRNWTYTNFARGRSENGDKEYVDLMQFASIYDLPLSTIMLVYSDREPKYFAPNNGDFGKRVGANQIAEWLCEIKRNGFKFVSKIIFVRSVLSAFDLYTDKQMKKLAKNILKVPKCSSKDDYLTCFKNIIK